MSVAPYDAGAVEAISSTLDLRAPNFRALDALARAIDAAPDGAELVADLATGVGKTYIAGALLDYLFEAGVRNVVIITPGSTIQRKTIDNLTPGHAKFLRGLACRPVVITLDDLERGTVGQALDDPGLMKVFVFTVQSLLRPDTQDARRAHRPHEVLGQALSDYLRDANDLVVIADEHHVYFSTNAKKFRKAIEDLEPTVLIGLTATPHEATPVENIVFHYPLAEAIADGFVKIPVLVARADAVSDTRTQMADGVALLNAKAAAMRAYCSATKQTYLEPVLFVVASTIDEANRLAEILSGPDMLGRAEDVLVVTSEEPEETLVTLDALDEPTSKVRAVVSVSMLKEGWDVKSIYVIAAVRALESQLLTEQILGRGLRLPFGRRTGVGMLDTVEVVSHHAFSELLAHAEALLTQTLGQRASAARAVVEHTPGVAGEGLALPGTSLAESDTAASISGGNIDGQVVVNLPGVAVAENDGVPGQGDLFSDEPTEHQVAGIATVDSRISEAKSTAATLAAPLVARAVGGVRVPLFIPNVSTRWVREPFSLTQVSLVDVEALGARFATDHAPTLLRKGLDAERDDAGGVHVIITEREGEVVEAFQERLPFASIELDLTQRLLSSNEVAATTTEANAAAAIARAFMEGVGITEDTPWRSEHARWATEALIGWLRTKQTSTPVREVADVSQVRWPDPLEITLMAPPANRHLVVSRAEFVRSYPYSGWTRSVFDAVSFHAYSTEFRMAELFDASDGVKAWVRITPDVPIRIGYTMGAITRFYEPDFIVIDDAGRYWVVEGKADADMGDATVIAKREAARAWVNAVNASPDITTQWGYMLSSESAVASAGGTWSALKAASQVFSG